MKHLNITEDQLDLVKEALVCASIALDKKRDELNEMGLCDTAKDIAAKYVEYGKLIARIEEQTEE